MRVALVSPYSWTYPGGVTRHIEALAEELLVQGHDVRVLAPVDRDTRRTALLHGGARPARVELPEYVVPLGGTAGIPMNGAMSNLSLTPHGVAAMRRELRAGGYDVVHVHAPEAPVLSWDALCSSPAPLVGTFHVYSTSPVSNNVANVAGALRRFNRLGVRIAVSEAAAWTARRFFGGRYRIVPNGVHLPDPALLGARADGDGARGPGDRPLEILFVGQVVERKGLPVLLRAFEALREHVPARLTLVGPTREEVEPLLLDARGVTALGKVDDAEKSRRLARADVLCAPSLGGESFGMVLTEAFAHGTPVVASHIAGYADVVRHGVDGLLVPPGDGAAVAGALRDLALDRERRRAMGAAARERAERYAWPHVAREVVEAYEDAVAVPAPATAAARAATRIGLRPADGGPLVPPRRLPSLEPAPERRPRPGLAFAKRAALLAAALLAMGGAWLALQRIGVDAILQSLVNSSPSWTLIGLGVMCASMVLRAQAWHAILRAALPQTRVRRADALQGTMIGVLMSATLPARLGEPARALIVARRLGRPRERLPVVLGTLVSQTLLNILALVVLGVTMLSTVDLFTNNRALVGVTIAPVVVLLCVLVAPAVLRSGGPAAARRALTSVRRGLMVFRRPRLGATAAAAQLGAWALQWLACYVLLVAFGLDDRAGIGAAAAVLFAVNVTAVLPAVPSNLGVFQAACVAVLHAYGVGSADALAYGIVLQAVEIATAVLMGAPALVREGLSWRDVRLRALHASPVTLPEPAAEPAPAPAR
ncbi:MAG TPA: lysylphosphatidylglycerol synthase domain-containing protein [Solirubrobacteraceae bacterium]|nr:lysylphosphatidylglycerol synthase domain-containing protein [Solirubrobacteraceae bacterium]